MKKLLPLLLLLCTAALVSCSSTTRHTSDQYTPANLTKSDREKEQSQTWFGRLFSGQTHNNDVPISELVRYIITKTDAAPCCDMEPGPIHAESGFSVMLGGRQVAFYKYNTRRKKMRKKLDWIIENKCVFILGQKYPAMVNGSFVMIDYEKNPKKDLLVKVFQEF